MWLELSHVIRIAGGDYTLDATACSMVARGRRKVYAKPILAVTRRKSPVFTRADAAGEWPMLAEQVTPR